MKGLFLQMNLAILIDAENILPSSADFIFNHASSLGNVVRREIYGAATALTAWVSPVLKYAIHPNLTIKAAKGKNSSDIALVIGAMDMLLAGGIDAVVIASSDSDFSALSVRLRNAADLSPAGADGRPGLSVVTDLPLYVEGCFNTGGQKGTANDPCTDKPPTLVAADAVTMLSSNWDDAWRKPRWEGWNGTDPTSVRPAENKDTRRAKETTFNGILMTGIVESNGGNYSGGLENFFRFHEHWSIDGVKNYNFNGSMVCMWTSHIASNPIDQSNNTYEPPGRLWGWAKMSPPGLPNLLDIQESDWERIDVSQYADDAFFH